MSDDYDWIDLHHHVMPEFYVKALAQQGITELSGVPIPTYNTEDCLKDMDKVGIDKAILSLPASGLGIKKTEFLRDLTRQTNTHLAEVVREHPTRFGAMATMPLPDIEAAFVELDYALDELHLDGVVLQSNFDGLYLGDPELDEFFAELNRRELVVFVHPDDPPFADMCRPDVPIVHIEWPFDTTRAVANMVYSGVLDRCPNIRFILSHGGGAVPYLAWRISILEYRQRDKVKKLRSLYDLILKKQGPATGMKLLKKMYYDGKFVDILRPIIADILAGSDRRWAESKLKELVNKACQELMNNFIKEFITIKRK